MRAIRRLLVGACIGAVLTGLISCGSSAPETPDRRVLTYWAVNMAPTVTANQDILERQLAIFTERTGIEVDLEIMTWSSAYTRIMTAVTSGRTPDVVDIGNTWSATLQATGAFVAFDEAAMAAIGGRERFVATSMTATGAAGSPPASIPLYAQSFGLFYNTKMFAAAGISRPPNTWAEFVADAKKLTRPGQWGVGLVGASSGGNAHLAFVLGRQHGARLFDDTGEPQFDTPAMKDAIVRLIGLMTNAKVVDPGDAEHSGLNDALAALADGRAAMVPFQSGGRTYLSSIGFSDYAVAPLPVLEPLPPGGSPIRSFVAGTNIAVFRNASHPADALEFVKFLTDRSTQVALNKAFRTLPVVTDAYDDPAFSGGTTDVFAGILREHSETMPMVPGEGQMEQVLGGAISDLWARAATGTVSDADIAAALTRATEQMPGER